MSSGGGGAAGASSVVGGVGGFMKGKDQAQADQYNAQINEDNAKYAEVNTVENLRRQTLQANQQMGGLQASIGASGVTSDGSAGDVIRSSASSAELDRLWMKYNGDLKAKGFRDTAQMDRNAASSAESGAWLSLFGGAFGGAMQAGGG